jgi:hypothetical protein
VTKQIGLNEGSKPTTIQMQPISILSPQCGRQPKKKSPDVETDQKYLVTLHSLSPLCRSTQEKIKLFTNMGGAKMHSFVHASTDFTFKRNGKSYPTRMSKFEPESNKNVKT